MSWFEIKSFLDVLGYVASATILIVWVIFFLLVVYFGTRKGKKK